MSKYLIVNADDFGLTQGVVKGIIDSANPGIVTSTTVLINELVYEKFSFNKNDCAQTRNRPPFNPDSGQAYPARSGCEFPGFIGWLVHETGNALCPPGKDPSGTGRERMARPTCSISEQFSEYPTTWTVIIMSTFIPPYLTFSASWRLN